MLPDLQLSVHLLLHILDGLLELLLQLGVSAILLLGDVLILLRDANFLLLQLTTTALQLRLRRHCALHLGADALLFLGHLCKASLNHCLTFILCPGVFDPLRQRLMEHPGPVLIRGGRVLHEGLDLCHLGIPIGPGRGGQREGRVVLRRQALDLRAACVLDRLGRQSRSKGRFARVLDVEVHRSGSAGGGRGPHRGLLLLAALWNRRACLCGHPP
mmetsp:Transcript_99157/g.221322  ORF Transcript_99157/g.221322 Transcript_99157/m.221322 type:complete len:215 (+) Transcript_99157:538-1182(+)